jgi:hypothetical protein
MASGLWVRTERDSLRSIERLGCSSLLDSGTGFVAGVMQEKLRVPNEIQVTLMVIPGNHQGSWLCVPRRA